MQRSSDVKLAIFGRALSSSWGDDHAPSWRGLCRALHDDGHEVVFFERDLPFGAAHRDLADPGYCRLVLYREWGEVARRAERELADADAGIVTACCPDALAAGEALTESRALRVLYDLDTWRTLQGLEHGEPPAHVGPRALVDFDLVLGSIGGRSLAALETRLGAKRALPLYPSVDPRSHRPIAPDPVLRGDLCHVGAFAADRRRALDALFLEPARRLGDKRFVVVGAHFPEDFPWRENTRYVRQLAPVRHPAFYCSARWTLDITGAALAQHGHCPSPHLFQAAACGSPIVADPWDGLDALFEPGREIAVARSSDDVVAALGLPEPARRKIAEAARRRTLAQHSARARSRQLIGYLREAW